jgi:hypothetical protein
VTSRSATLLFSLQSENENKDELNVWRRHVRESGWSREKAEASFRKHSQQLRQALIIQHNCHMAKLFLPVFIQVRNPLFDFFCIKAYGCIVGVSDFEGSSQFSIVVMHYELSLLMLLCMKGDISVKKYSVIKSLFLLRLETKRPAKNPIMLRIRKLFIVNLCFNQCFGSALVPCRSGYGS